MRNAIKFIALLAFIAAPSFVTDAAAGTVCPNNIGFDAPIWDNVTPVADSSDCEIGSTNNDSVAQVNLDDMFGIDTWQLLAASGDTNYTSATLCADPDSEPAGTCDNSTGWVYPADIESLMLVLKDGEGIPDNYVGYFIDGFPSIIEILNSPFINPQSGNAKEISHWNLYWSEDGGSTIQEVPEPATMLLVGGGLLAAVRRRRAKR